MATIRLFRAMNNGTIAGLNANQFRGQAHTLHGNAGAVNTITGQSFIPDEIVWKEDWSIAGGRPTDLAPNVPMQVVGYYCSSWIAIWPSIS